jgi:CDP-glucose 4,6-dehydratase
VAVGHGAVGEMARRDVTSFWSRRRVLITGHTGFKGGWLAAWLAREGSVVTGLALPPAPGPGFFRICGMERRLTSVFGDVRDAGRVSEAFVAADPEVVFHLAAQPLVRRGHVEPVLTFETNVLGTVNVLEAARAAPSVRAVVVVTSDKCYLPAKRRHTEDDALGGDDPYGASKAAAEIVARAYRMSYFVGQGRGVATVRAGNVIGGGDWSEDRVVPDAVRAFASGQSLAVRHPGAVRPWQHVLDPLGGYLRLAERLAADPGAWSEAWNFGPREAATVAELVTLLAEAWPGARWSVLEGGGPREDVHLALDSSKAADRLGWQGRFGLEEAVAATTAWYRRALIGTDPDEMLAYSSEQIERWRAAA